MTVTVSLTSEKEPTPESPAMAPVAREPHTGTGKHLYNNTFLKSKCGMLKVAEIALTLLMLFFVFGSYWYSAAQYILIFLTVNTSLLTAIVLWDNVNGEKLRNLIRLDVCPEKLELRYNAIVALLLYTVSFFALVCNFDLYDPMANILMGVTGMLASIAYAYDWWLLYRERLLDTMIATKVEEFSREHKERGAVLNV